MANKKLIDAKALFDDLADYWGIPKDWDGRIEQVCEDALSAIENAPEVDAVEVVRCKDCKHYVDGPYDNGDMMCDCWGEWIFPNDNDFCSQGERKDKE